MASRKQAAPAASAGSSSPVTPTPVAAGSHAGHAHNHDTKPQAAVGPEVVDKATVRFGDVRRRLRYNAPFFFYLLQYAIVKWDTTPWDQEAFETNPHYNVNRAATDGEFFYFNADWFQGYISDAQAAGAMVHEVMHCSLRHMSRRGSREPKVWNIAGDSVINYTIKLQYPAGQVQLPLDVVENDDLAAKYSTEEIYDILIKKREEDRKKQKDKNKKKDPNQPQDPGGGGGGGSPSDEEPDDQEGDGQGGQGKDRQPDPNAPKGKGKGGKGKPTSDKPEDNQQEGAGGRKYDKSKPWEASVSCAHDPAEESARDADKVREIEERWKRATEHAAQKAMEAGKMPGDLQRVIERAYEPMVDWRQVLYQFVTRAMDDFLSWNRGQIYRGLYMETLDSETVTIYVVIDTSGSVGGPELDLMMSEVRSIMQSFPNLIAKGYWADADVYGPHTLEEMTSMQAKGGGGTDFRPAFAAIEEDRATNSQGQAVVLYLTDGAGAFPEIPPVMPTLWVVIPGGITSPDHYPFGEVVKMSRE